MEEALIFTIMVQIAFPSIQVFKKSWLN